MVTRCIPTTDAHLDLAGSVCGMEYFHHRFTVQTEGCTTQKLQLKILAVSIPAKVWAGELAGKLVRIQSDNEATV